MAWKDTLQDASWRGVPFEVEAVSDALEWSVAQAEYPYLAGGEVEDLGRHALRLELNAIWFGDDYEQRLQQFIAAAEQPGSGELVHPILGSLPARLVSMQISHDAELVDGCKVQLAFVEDRLGRAVFDRVLPVQQAAQASLQAEAVERQAGAVLTLQLGQLNRLQDAASQIEQWRDKASNILSDLARQVNGVIYSGLDIINTPLSLISDIRTALDRMAGPLLSLLGEADSPEDVAPASSGERLAVWHDVVARLTPAAPPDHPIQQLLQLQQATSVARLTASMLAAELDQPELAPAQVEQLLNRSRKQLQAVIRQYRDTLPLEQSRPVAECARQLAWQLQETARHVILLRPPLVVRQVEAAGSLVLIAHRWYGDWQRAQELLRLNPTLRHPNFLPAGYRLHAYAR